MQPDNSCVIRYIWPVKLLWRSIRSTSKT